MVAMQDPFRAREARLGRNCRDGLLLAERDPAYRAAVLDRLRAERVESPDDLWTAIPWIWTTTLGAEPPRRGAMAPAIWVAADVLREWLRGDEPIEMLHARWNASGAAELGLGSTLRSHPFADLRAWLLRPPSVA